MLTNQIKKIKFKKITVPNCMACKHFCEGKCDKYEYKMDKNKNYSTEKKASYIIARKYDDMCGMDGKGFECNIKNEIEKYNEYTIINSFCALYTFPAIFILIKIVKIDLNLMGTYFYILLNNSFFIYHAFKNFNKKKQLEKIPKEIEIVVYDE